jgi:hypothetical protein
LSSEGPSMKAEYQVSGNICKNHITRHVRSHTPYRARLAPCKAEGGRKAARVVQVLPPCSKRDYVSQQHIFAFLLNITCTTCIVAIMIGQIASSTDMKQVTPPPNSIRHQARVGGQPALNG